MRLRLLLTSTVALGVCAAQPAFAQDVPAAGSADSGEIVVTAQKRSQSAQKVPISIAVTSAVEIAQQNITSLRQLSKISPSVTIQQSGRSDKLSIRGVSSGVNPSLEQSVGVFVDGIYHGRSRVSAAGFLDLARVEVLKGPQSIFFGNSSIAGAMNVITQKPTDTFSGYARALYGEDQEYLMEAAVGGPVTDTISVRVAGNANGIGGWMNDRGAGYKIPKNDERSGRATLLWRPSDDLDVTLKAEASRSHSIGGSPSQPVNCPVQAPFTVNGNFCNKLLAGGGEGNLDLNRNFSNVAGSLLKTQEYVSTINYRIGGHTITSVTGYSKNSYKTTLDLDETPETLFNLYLPERYRQFSQELRLASPEGQAIEYIAGLYYQRGKLRGESDGLYFFLPTAGTFAAFAPVAPLGQYIGFREKSTNYSAFASLTWNVSSALKVTGGLRYQKVKKDFFQQVGYGRAPNPVGTPVLYTGANAALAQAYANAFRLGPSNIFNLNRSDDKFTPSINAQYTASNNLMFYGSYANGFKAGGFNAIDVTGNAANLPFNPEKVNAFEAGMKSRLFDRRLLLNVAVFRAVYNPHFPSKALISLS